ncbi:MAG TPA: OB-fold domain-containing protein [Microthrixaceae bacterium]|nr:OB-fold domain-containing protein [Microthrixaceae bacterium]
MTTEQIAFAPDVFTWPSDEPQLIGGRCTNCSAVTFPQTGSCARCGSTEVDAHLLPRRGTLWTFTTQGFLPKEPYAGGETQETFQPYGVGMVELGDEVRIEGRLTEADPERLQIGMAMELVIIPFRTDPDGTEVMTFAFTPSPDSQQEA